MLKLTWMWPDQFPIRTHERLKTEINFNFKGKALHLQKYIRCLEYQPQHPLRAQDVYCK